jgi:hypothetical protein
MDKLERPNFVSGFLLKAWIPSFIPRRASPGVGYLAQGGRVAGWSERACSSLFALDFIFTIWYTASCLPLTQFESPLTSPSRTKNRR